MDKELVQLAALVHSLPMNGHEEDRAGTTAEQMVAKAFREIYGSSVGLVVDDQLRGSGTLVVVGDQYGILTAQHVTSILKRHPDFKLQLTIEERPHCFVLDERSSYLVEVGVPASADEFLGPDLSFVRILNLEKIGTLRAKKMFYPMRRQPSFPRDFPYEDLGWAVSGAPSVMIEPTSAKNQLPLKHFLGAAQFESKTVRGEFDFISLRVNHAVESFPDAYGGVSGGGMWILPTTNGSGGWFCDAPILGGVAYCEGEISGTTRLLIGHGPASLNRMLPAKLAEAV